MRTQQLQTQGGSLLALYSEAQNSKKFMRLIRNNTVLDAVAREVPSSNRLHLLGSSILVNNPNIKPKTAAEVMISQALLRVGVSVMFEPVHFYLTLTGLRYNPDIWTNIYLKNRDAGKMVMMETHGFERLRGKNLRGNFVNRKFAEKKERTTVNKMITMHQTHPEIYFILFSDMKREKFLSEFVIRDMSAVCDEYRETARSFDRPDTLEKAQAQMHELKIHMKQIKRMPGAKLQKDRQVWFNDIGKIIKQELHKALQ
ncbi:MAG: hypothetical protein ACREBF_04455 [Candidatus Micrarchaeales archaeon]